ncbi:SDR family oxidoreductase [Acidisoma cellulosilytica]|uniref:SDR family oxidoreductase n=1 Tax=Acidisoma cellulosilyticum TaxID=2802395 RepID=A0A963Z4T3_9PROT|nr:SDR family oxidoreductase [Acidisoma cellulosilyticum]MCB8882476.1 SDR family oxidoreductase [Acidisoma cellulosilyticum]
MNKMDGKICLVAGATQGLGAAIALRLAEAGAAGLVITGRSAEKGKALAQRIEAETGCSTHFIRADLTSVADCKRVVNETEAESGALHVLVNAGALTDRGTILDTTPELFDRMMATNLRGPFFLMQAAIRQMIRHNIAGAICNIGSMSALSGQPFLSAYSTSKGALATLTANTAFAVMKNRIRVNQINLGWMASDHEIALQTTERGDADWLSKVASEQPFGRLIDPAEAARAVNFLVSEDAGLMTGAVVNYDQSIWGAADQMPIPDAPLSLPELAQ